jgi:uncharacterized membrane protein YbhN (UPF0104 family)
VARHLAAANPWLVLPAVAGLAAAHVVMALGWRSMLRRLGDVRLPASVAVRSYYAAQALGGVTPANLGGDLYRAAALRAGGHGWRAAVLPIVVQRATSYAALGALSLGAVAVLAAAGVGGPILLLAAGVGCVVLALAAVLLAPDGAFDGLHRRLIRLVGGAEPPRDGGRFLGGLRGGAAIGLATGAAFHAVSVVLTWAVLAAVDPALATPAVAAAITIARLSLAVPLSPSGIGVQEGALAALVAALGGPVDAAVAGMLLARLGLVVTTAVGAACIAQLGRRATGAPATSRGRA